MARTTKPIVVTKSPTQTKNLAAQMALKILRSRPTKTAKVFGLVGDLGSGKTTFIQGFIKMLGVRQRVMSPTFLIFRNYQLPITSPAPTCAPPMASARRGLRRAGNYQFRKVYHVDLYRIHSFRELKPLGFRKILSNPQNIVLIEWANKIRRYLPRTSVWLRFEHGQRLNERSILF